MGHVGRADTEGEVQHAGPIGHQDYAGLARYPSETIGHQCRSLLVANADELQVGTIVERVEDVQEGRTYDSKDMGDSFLTEEFNYGFAGFHLSWHLGEPPGVGVKLDCRWESPNPSLRKWGY